MSGVNCTSMFLKVCSILGCNVTVQVLCGAYELTCVNCILLSEQLVKPTGMASRSPDLTATSHWRGYVCCCSSVFDGVLAWTKITFWLHKDSYSPFVMHVSNMSKAVRACSNVIESVFLVLGFTSYSIPSYTAQNELWISENFTVSLFVLWHWYFLWIFWFPKTNVLFIYVITQNPCTYTPISLTYLG